jgi:hypothetical protein
MAIPLRYMQIRKPNVSRNDYLDDSKGRRGAELFGLLKILSRQATGGIPFEAF